MGKNKNKNKNKGQKPKQQHGSGGGNKPKSNPGKAVFKVAGARSLKAKNKTQKLNLNLKKIQAATRSTTETADQQLTKVEETLRNTAVASTAEKDKSK